MAIIVSKIISSNVVAFEGVIVYDEDPFVWRRERRPMQLRRMIRLVSLLIFLVPHIAGAGRTVERGILSIFFREEKVGYEDYVWTEDAEGFELSVTGRMSGPLTLEIERLIIRWDRGFIARSFSFKGTVNGVAQDIESAIREGSVTNKITVAGQVIESSASVRRDALLLPNPIFSPYLLLAKKFGCGLRTPSEISVYIIPQVEIAGRLETKPETPCVLVMTLAGVETTLVTDEERSLQSISIPGQGLRVTVRKNPSF